MTSVDSNLIFCVDVHMGLDPLSPVHMRPPEPDALPPPCGRHKWMAPNLQFLAVFPAHVPSRTLHHPANPLYSIIILFPFSTTGHFSSCSPTEPYPSLHHVFGMTYCLNSA